MTGQRPVLYSVRKGKPLVVPKGHGREALCLSLSNWITEAETAGKEPKSQGSADRKDSGDSSYS